VAEPLDDPERGSVLLLVPIALLVVLLLTALVADSASAFLAERELADAAAAAANDAVAAGLDPAALRTTGERRLDPERVCAIAAASLRALERPLVDEALAADPCPAHVGEDGASVVVELHAESPAPFGHGIPGAPDAYAVHATRTARLDVA
jgi:hypothetical protein